MVADVDGDHRVLGEVLGQGREDGRRGDPSAAVVGGAARLLGPPDRPALGDVATLVLGAAPAATDRCGQGGHDERGITEQVRGHRVEPADRGRGVVDLHDRLPRRDAGVVRERRADDEQQVRLVHQPARDGSAAAAEHTGTERMRVGDQPLGLERREHRCPELLGQSDDLVACCPGAVPDHDHRAPGCRDQFGCAGQCHRRRVRPAGGSSGRRGSPPATRTAAPAPRRVARGAQRRGRPGRA